MTYYVAVNGTKKDPLSEEALRAMITAGTIGADALCWREGWSNWQPVPAAFPELFPNHTPAAPVQPNARASAPLATTPGDAEAIRKENLNHEASLRSVGFLYIFAAVVLTLFGAALLCGFSPNEHKTSGEPAPWILAVVFLPLGVLYFVIGRWLRALNPKARTPATIFAVLGLLGFPFGTLINGYILYLLRSKKGALVFSESYREVVAATPHIKYKTSIVIWILLGLVLLLMSVAIIGGIVSGAHHG